MNNWANLPADRRRAMIVAGINTFDDLGLMLAERDMPPAVPKTYTVDVPGGHGEIDLTEAFMGDVAYGNRSMSFTFELITGQSNIEDIRDKLVNLLHGRRLDFTFTFDMDYTYTGRFSVESTKTNGPLQRFVVKVDADPWKRRKDEVISVNVTNGALVTPVSGRKAVQPTFEFSHDTYVYFKGMKLEVPAGTFKLNDVWFEEGENELFLLPVKYNRNLTHLEASSMTYAQIKHGRRIYEWYNGIEKHYVNSMRLVPNGSDISGSVTLTANFEDGTSKSQVVNLRGHVMKSITVGGSTVCDELSINGDEARLIKRIGYSQLSEQPSDWNENWNSYYTVIDVQYRNVSGSSAPAFSDGVYYSIRQLTSEPEGWSEDFRRYYELVDDGIYQNIVGDSAPVFSDGVYYSIDMLLEQPYDWVSSWFSYYEKIVSEYRSVPGSSAPEFYDGRYFKFGVMDSPEQHLITCEIMYSNSSPVESVTSSAGIVEYTSSNRILNVVWESVPYSNYAYGGSDESRHIDMASMRHSQLYKRIVNEDCEYDDIDSSVFIKYEWRDL